MRHERPGHSLQATALVHEAYARIAGNRPDGWTSPGQFYSAAAEAMRRILIDHARGRGRVKRGGGRRCVPLSVLDLAAEQDEEQIMAVDAALRRLEEQVDGDAAKVVQLRFFAGLSVEQTAEALGVSARTVKRDWAFARAWLHQALEGDMPGS
jgi:RNA polymerase sigma factor (TIGR02999 family)